MRFKHLFLMIVFLIACSARVETPQPSTSQADASDAVTDAAEPEAQETMEEVLEATEEAVEEPQAPVEEPQTPAEPEPETLAQKFVAAGGQRLCEAMVYALNPDWRMDACKATTDEDRREACENQRRPLVKYTEDICKTVIEESLRLDLDPGMVLAVIERESSFGRATWDRQDRRYEVQTDICKLTLPKSRIVERRPGRREGTELMTWTYGPQAPRSGEVARNRQPVRVVEEDDDRVVLDTCSAGEAGIMQTVPREWRAGTTIEATGEVLAGSTAERRARVEGDPVLQVRLGCQALAEHRALAPVEQQADWRSWIFVYNTGSTTLTDHARSYTAKIVRHYLDGCKAWMPDADAAGPLDGVDVEDVWPECARMQEAYEALRGREE